jgi:excisionase family DNA binding protein
VESSAEHSQLKKRIVRALLQEIIVKKANERIWMVLHWQGGDHTTLEFLMSRAGKHRDASPENLVSLVRELARVQPDQAIVAILNRMGQRTGRGNTWTETRLRVFRRKYNIDVHTEGERLARGELTLEETAKTLKLSRESIRRLIAEKSLSAQQACKGAPWIIPRADVERLAAAAEMGSPRPTNVNQISLKLQ